MRLFLLILILGTTTILVPHPSAIPAALAASTSDCDENSGGGVNGVSGGGWVDSTCPGGNGYTQRDYWGWHCSHHGGYDVGVTIVEYSSATHGEYINEHPISLPANLTSEQLQALQPLTYQRRSCLRAGAVLSTRIYPVDSSGRSLEEIIASARARVEPPIPSITRLPSFDDGNAVVVQTPLWVWTTDPVSETATDGASLRVSVTSQLQDMTFTLAGSNYNKHWTCDPTQVQVSGAGLSGEQYLQPDNYNACHLIVEHSSTGEPNNTFTLTANATWTFTYAINGSAPFPIPGTVTRTNSFEVDAVEILIMEN